MMAMDPPVVATANVVMIVLSAGILLSLGRLVRGPSLPDRVVALDIIALLIVAIVGVYSIRHSEPVLLRVAMVVTLVNFVGSVAFAYYLDRRLKQ